ncbi:MAG: LCP family protein [Actinomycetota bacterium]
MNVAIIAASLLIAGALDFAGQRASSINRVALDRSLTPRPEAAQGERAINVLLVGSDSSANLDADDPIQIGRQGERLGDVIIIAHLDERTGQVALLSLPRDLWVPVAGTQRSDRINRAFLVGGPATLIDTIEEAFGIPIHHYVNVDFAGFQGLVEAVGSVDVYFDSPARDWNANAVPTPRSQTGFLVETPGCHALDPEQALAYVRSRYYQTQDANGRWVTDPTSDLGRIERQQDFLQRLMQRAIDLGARNPLVLTELIDTGIRNVAIDQDLTPALLLDLGAAYRSFEPGQIETHTFPVRDGVVGTRKVLLPQMSEVAPILELFAGARFDDPATVAVDVVYDSALDDADQAGEWPREVEDALAALRAAGFEPGEPAPSTVGPGVQIWHDDDGFNAAAIVADAVGGAPMVADAVTGRNVTVAIGAGITTAVASGAPPVDDSSASTTRPATGPVDGEVAGPATSPSVTPDDAEGSEQAASTEPESGGQAAAGDLAADHMGQCG